MSDKIQLAKNIQNDWDQKDRWKTVKRSYTALDVAHLRGSLKEEYTLANHSAQKLWKDLHENNFIPALGALTGMQALQQVKAGLKAIYVSGWQVAADANMAGQTYPDQYSMRMLFPKPLPTSCSQRWIHLENSTAKRSTRTSSTRCLQAFVLESRTHNPLRNS